MNLPPSQRNKHSLESTKCAFMGYSTSQKTFICYDPCSHKFRISRNIVFFENHYFFPMIITSSFASHFIPTFEYSSTCFKRFKPGFLYERRQPTLSYPDTDPPPETVSQLESENSSRSGHLEPT